MLSNEIKSLSISERMHLMEEIWDSLCHESVPVESPAWHKETLDERMARVLSGQAKFMTLQELKDSNR
ncbi:MAG: addiction module protein [Methylomonas lenta]|nr:addiction module protein [Methylomonas lenta]